MTKEFILTLIGRSRQQLISTFLAVPDDKLTWKPLDNGRSALELFSEAANTFAMATEFIASKGEIKPSREKFGELVAISAGWGKDEAVAAMEANYAAYLKAWESITPEDLEAPITMPFGPGMTAPLGVWAMLPNRTCTVRFGQINYIQTLYGDFEGH
ncbi:DinB family protein [bacterium]|nr:MAG: DinB family protein [bacterium]